MTKYHIMARGQMAVLFNNAIRAYKNQSHSRLKDFIYQKDGRQVLRLKVFKWKTSNTFNSPCIIHRYGSFIGTILEQYLINIFTRPGQFLIGSLIQAQLNAQFSLANYVHVIINSFPDAV